MQPNQERVHKLFPDLIMQQPHRERILRKLFLSKGFSDLGKLVKTSIFVDSFIEEAKDTLKDEDVELYEGRRPDDNGHLVSAYMKMDVPEGVNPLDLLRVSKKGIDNLPRGNRTRFSLELGSTINIEPYVRAYELVRRQRQACVMRRDGRDAVEYLLDMPDKKVA